MKPTYIWSVFCLLTLFAAPSLAAEGVQSKFHGYMTRHSQTGFISCDELKTVEQNIGDLNLFGSANFGNLWIGTDFVGLWIGDLSTRVPAKGDDSGGVVMKAWPGLPSNLDEVHLQPRRDTPCQVPPKSFQALFGEVLAVFSAADAAVEVCLRDEAQCSQAAFGVVDITGDLRVSRAELSRAIRVVGFFAPLLAEPRKPATFNNSLASMSAAGMMAPAIAQNLIDGSDYDGDGQLSLDEIMQDRGTVDFTSLAIVARTGLTEHIGRSVQEMLGVAMKTLFGSVMGALR